jgi:hypothetical protein
MYLAIDFNGHQQSKPLANHKNHSQETKKDKKISIRGPASVPSNKQKADSGIDRKLSNYIQRPSGHSMINDGRPKKSDPIYDINRPFEERVKLASEKYALNGELEINDSPYLKSRYFVTKESDYNPDLGTIIDKKWGYIVYRSKDEGNPGRPLLLRKSNLSPAIVTGNLFIKHQKGEKELIENYLDKHDQIMSKRHYSLNNMFIVELKDPDQVIAVEKEINEQLRNNQVTTQLQLKTGEYTVF